MPKYLKIDAAADGADAAGSGMKGKAVPITTPDAIVMVGFASEARLLKGADQAIDNSPKATKRKKFCSISWEASIEPGYWAC
jgi:hypothetical protein